MPHVGVNGQRIYYEDSGGGGDRLPLVLAHGLLMDHEMFAPQVAAFGADRRVVTWDERGHGLTETTPDDFSYWDSADDLRGLLDALGIQRAVVGGMSQGGFVSLRFALRWPERVAGLVLIDSQAGLEDPAVAPGYEQMHQAWLEYGPGPVQEVVASIILGPGQWDGWYAKWNEQYAQWAPDDLGQLSWPFRCLMDRDDITGRLAGITCPALIVHGTADAGIPLTRAEVVRDGLDGPVTFIVVEGAAHASNVTHPDEVNQAILGFLSGLDAG